MAVQSTVGSSIIDMFTGVGRSGSQLAATRSQEITNEAGYQALDRKASLDLMDEIEGAGNYRIDPTSTDGQLFKYDFARIAKERPDLAKKILNRDPRFNRATDESGRVIETQIDSFKENADGSFSVIVTRPDGKKAPVTNNRTAQDDDVIARIPADEFSRYGSDIMTSIRGADGASTYMRDAARISQGMISQAAKEAAAARHADDPKALTQLTAIINSASGEDLEEIARDLGVDPASIRAEVEQNSQTSPQNGLYGAIEMIESGGDPNAVSAAGAVGPMQLMPGTAADPGYGIEPAKDDSPEENRRVGSEYIDALLKKYDGNLDHALYAYNWGPGNVDKWIAAGEDPSALPKETAEYVPKVKAQLEKQSAAAEEPVDYSAQAAGFEMDEAETATETGALIAQLAKPPRKPTRNANPFDDLASSANRQASSAETQKKLEDRKTALESGLANREKLNASRAAKNQPPMDWTRGGKEDPDKLQKELDLINRFTGAEPAETDDMTEAGITPPVPLRTEEDVKSAILESLEDPSDELAQKVATLMKKKGITRPEDLSKLPSQEANMAVWLMSSRMPGTVEAKLKVANELFNYVNTGSMDTTADMKRKTDVSVAKFQNELGEQYKAEIKMFGVEIEEAVESLGVVQAGTIDDDNEAMEPTKEASIELGKMWTKIGSLKTLPTSKKRNALNKVAVEAFMYHLQGVIASDVKGWTDFQGMYDDFFNDNGRLKTGNLALSQLIRVQKDGSGEPTGLIFSNGKGGSNDYAVTLTKLREYYAGDLLDEIVSLAVKNTKATS